MPSTYVGGETKANHLCCSAGVLPLLLPPRRSMPRAENLLGDADRNSLQANDPIHRPPNLGGVTKADHPSCSAGVMLFLLPPSWSKLRAENILGDADRQMIPRAVHPPRGCDKGKSSKLLRGVMPFLLPPSRSRLRAENILGDAYRQMIPYAVHPPRGCDEGRSFNSRVHLQDTLPFAPLSLSRRDLVVLWADGHGTMCADQH
ncbi:hypothetical protein DFS34DRAFT_645689 [Phlyctochytrium arcticum]|nr:hypothetical protein DFS34DRAFT_645689 [Phlyctochytrium arcticum]